VRRGASTLPVALVATVVIHLAFYKLLRIPLPGDSSSAMLFSKRSRSCFDPYVLWVILGSAMFGLFVGAVPGSPPPWPPRCSCR
jgi:hypothetical protein